MKIKIRKMYRSLNRNGTVVDSTGQQIMYVFDTGSIRYLITRDHLPIPPAGFPFTGGILYWNGLDYS